MFILFSILLSAAILGVMYFFSKNREASFHHKYELVSELRAIVTLCRQHRSASHHILYYGNPKSHEITQIEKKIMTRCDNLVERAHFDNKPIYRILQSKLAKMIDEWEGKTISQNQMSHGRSIRHCMFLIDEVVLTWVIESQRMDLSDEYNLSWQQIIDTLEALTQFRIAIEDSGSPYGPNRLKLHAATMHRRLNQLSLISPLAISSPACTMVCEQLKDIERKQTVEFTKEQLYKISTDASLVIFNSYDYILSDLSETIYEPLPKLAMSV